MTRLSPRFKKILAGAGIALVLYTVIGFWVLPFFLKDFLADKLSGALSRTVSIQKLSVNPYTLSAAVHRIIIEDSAGEVLFSADRLYSNLSLTSIFFLSPVVSSVAVDSPFVHIVRHADQSLNISDIVSGPSRPEPEETTAGTMDFMLKHLEINQGRIQVTDQAKDTVHQVTGIDLLLTSLTNRAEQRYEPARLTLSFFLEDAAFNIAATATPFAEDSAATASLTATAVDALHYMAYLEMPAPLVLKNLGLDLDLDAEYRMASKDTPVLLISGKAAARNLHLQDRQGREVLRLPSLNLDLLSSDIFKKKVVISRIGLSRPELHLERDDSGQLTLLERNDAPAPSTGPDIASIPSEAAALSGAESPSAAVGQETAPAGNALAPGFELVLNDLEIQDATISFVDTANSSPFETRIYPLNLHLTDVALNTTFSGQYAMDLQSDADEKLVTSGKFNLFPFSAKGRIQLEQIALDRYAPYLESIVGLYMKKGRFHLSCGFDLSESTPLAGQIQDIDVSVQKIAVHDRASDDQLLYLEKMGMENGRIDLSSRNIQTGTIRVDGADLFVQRFADGRLNLVSSAGSPQPSDAGPARQVSDDVSPAWALTINGLNIDDSQLRFMDLTPAGAPVDIQISDIQVAAADLSTIDGESGKIQARLRWNTDGQIAADGRLDLSDSSGDLSVTMSKIDIQSLQPYFTDAVKIVVTQGDINSSGNLVFQPDGQADQVKFDGDLSITDFVSLDKKTAYDFFKCRSFELSDLFVAATPLQVAIKDVSLVDFYSRIAISETGELNLSTIVEPGPPQDLENSEPSASRSPRIQIDNVTVQGGEIQFSDDYTQPGFTAALHKINGAVTGLSSYEDARADLNLKGTHGQSSPLVITGTINPLAQNKFVDIHMQFSDIELSHFTPYSARYLGYKIQKGKLLLDLKYLIEGNTLTSENRVQFDNFTLGESVDSDAATSLPISLAISLLRDRNGQINLDLPVTGRLDDPEFSIAGVVLKMIRNLILKVATSPFSIIGAMFGSGEELGYVEFESGRRTLNPDDFEKLDKLIRILEEKPEIRLEIQGQYHSEKDAAALVKKEMAASEDEAAGEASEETEQSTADIEIGQGVLRQLAIDRASAIRDYILSSNQVKNERIFVLEPVEADGSDQSETIRAVFSFK